METNGFHGNHWKFMHFHRFHGKPWIPWNSMKSMQMHGCHRILCIPYKFMQGVDSMDFHWIHRFPWNPLNPWISLISMDCHGIRWSHGFRGFPWIPWISMDSMDFHGIMCGNDMWVLAALSSHPVTRDTCGPDSSSSLPTCRCQTCKMFPTILIKNLSSSSLRGYHLWHFSESVPSSDFLWKGFERSDRPHANEWAEAAAGGRWRVKPSFRCLEGFGFGKRLYTLRGIRPRRIFLTNKQNAT